MNTKSSTPTLEHPLVAVLAAGRATRFGGGKLEAPCAGKPLAHWTLDAVADAGLSPGLLVTGPGSGLVTHGWRRVINPVPEQGLGTSLALAARVALAQGARTMLVLLADMPLIEPEYLRQLAARPAPSATRQADGRPGVPAVLDRALLQRALAVTGDRGAGPLLTDAELLEAPPGTLFDVDTADDLQRAARAIVSARARRAP